METIGLLFFLLLIFVAIYFIAGLPFYSKDYQPSAGGFFRFLIVIIGIGWIFGGGDDDPVI